jgi:hypothetical protein
MCPVDQPLISQVSAVSPLGGTIDGAPRPKLRRERKPPRAPVDGSLSFFCSKSFFCSNPQCEHGTWSPAEQARHMGREFWEAARALVRLAPESPEALKLTGDVILKDLTDDECREADRLRALHRRRGEPVPLRLRLIYGEHKRREHAGAVRPLTPSERGARTGSGGRSPMPTSPDSPAIRRATREMSRIGSRGTASRCRVISTALLVSSTGVAKTARWGSSATPSGRPGKRRVTPRPGLPEIHRCRRMLSGAHVAWPWACRSPRSPRSSA